MRLAQAAHNAGGFELSARHSAAAVRPDQATAWEMLGRSLERKGDVAGAAAARKRAQAK